MTQERKYCKVLIIDDEFIMRQGIKHMIEWEKEGFQIVGEAANGEEGLKVVEETDPHIILVDIVMPIIDGMEFTSIMKKRFPQKRIIILSSYDRFEYVKEALMAGAMDYVLKPSLNPEKLLAVLYKTVKTIPNMHLRKDKTLSIEEQITRYLSGYEIDIPESMIREKFPHNSFKIVCSNQRILCNGYREQEMDIYRILGEVLIESSDIVINTLRIKEEICCILFNFSYRFERTVDKIITEVTSRVSGIQPDTFWIIGENFHNFRELPGRYMSVEEVLPFRFYFKDKLFIQEKECSKSYKDSRFDYEAYSNLLKYQNFTHALNLLSDYVKDCCQIHMDSYMLKNITKNMIYSMIVECKKIDSEMDRRKFLNFREIDNCVYMEEFQQVFQDIISEIRELAIKYGMEEKEHINEICSYIRDHYNEELELIQLSKQFGYNYNYLSTYFNQQMKEGFSGYLNGIRIEKACEILKTTQNTISDISALVGYSDHSYFCRVFKNIKGRTPSEWRRSEIM